MKVGAGHRAEPHLVEDPRKPVGPGPRRIAPPPVTAPSGPVDAARRSRRDDRQPRLAAVPNEDRGDVAEPSVGRSTAAEVVSESVPSVTVARTEFRPPRSGSPISTDQRSEPAPRCTTVPRVAAGSGRTKRSTVKPRVAGMLNAVCAGTLTWLPASKCRPRPQRPGAGVGGVAPSDPWCGALGPRPALRCRQDRVASLRGTPPSSTSGGAASRLTSSSGRTRRLHPRHRRCAAVPLGADGRWRSATILLGAKLGARHRH